MLTYTLLLPILAMVLAQMLKIPIFFFISKKWKWSLAFSTGGMPSSHSATVSALTTAVGLVEGIQSTYFVICVVFSMIVMHDAAGVRRHAGYHAAVLNQLIQDFNQIVDTAKKAKYEKRDFQTLKEILGHKPIEVFFGALFGIGLALVIYPMYYG